MSSVRYATVPYINHEAARFSVRCSRLAAAFEAFEAAFAGLLAEEAAAHGGDTGEVREVEISDLINRSERRRVEEMRERTK